MKYGDFRNLCLALPEAEELETWGAELSELGNLLTYAGQHALLVVLQGRDASGKDGSIRKILD